MSDPSVAARSEQDQVAFQLPGYIREEVPWIGDIYDQMIADLQAEAFGIPMHTMQSMLIERIASTYALIRYHEHTNSWRGTNTEKDTNARWLDLVKEWNRLLAQGHEAMRSTLLEQVEKIALDGIQLIEDKGTRQALRSHFQSQFANLGI